MRDAGKQHGVHEGKELHATASHSSDKLHETQPDSIDISQYQSFFTTTIEGIADFQLMSTSSGDIYDYRIIEVNPPFEAITGLDKNTITGQKASDVFNNAVPPFLSVFKDIAKNKRPLTFETYFKEIERQVQISAFTTNDEHITMLIRELSYQPQAFNTIGELQHSAEIRKRELQCLYSIIHCLDQRSVSLDQKLYHVVNLLPSSFLHPRQISVQLTMYQKKYISNDFESSPIRHRSQLIEDNVSIGRLDVHHIPDSAEDASVFTQEKIQFLDTVARELSQTIRSYISKIDQQRLKGSMESTQYGVITTNAKGDVNFLNPIAERLTGFNCQQAIGLPLSKVFPILHISNRTPVNLDCATLHSKKKFHFQSKAMLPAASGQEYIIDIHAAPILNMSNQISECAFLFHDVTNTHKHNEVRLQDEKLSSLSLLAGGLAHDFNNILMTVLGNISLAKLDIAEDHEAYPILVKAEQKALKARELTVRLLSFSDRGTPLKHKKNVASFLTDVINHIDDQPLYQIKMELPENLCAAEFDAAQIESALSAIIENAKQAMPQGGEIRINVMNVVITSGSAQPLERGHYIRISVTDSGVGISDANMNRIFDPYFTTHEKQSGLGLATAFSIIKNHCGNIVVESIEGKGSTFHIYLPAIVESPARYRRTRKNTMIATRGRILIMDDEDTVLETAGKMLKKLGFDVTVTRDGHEAIQRFKEATDTDQPVEAAILDLNIPGSMGGKEAVQEILKINPGFKALVSSGYAHDPIISEFAKFGFSGVITKPYKLDELNAAIVKLLEC